jgi:hypothetical protein
MVGAFSPRHKFLCAMFAVIDSVSTAIDVYQVGRDVKPRDVLDLQVSTYLSVGTNR